MANPLMETKALRERAEAAERAGRWAEAAAGYEALAKSWLVAGGLAMSAVERQTRIGYAEAARQKAAECREKAGRRVTSSGGAGRNSGGAVPQKAEGCGSAEGAGKVETLEELLAQLDEMVGLAGVKKQVKSLVHWLDMMTKREAEGLGRPTISHHLVFAGNPGTGKTTVARLLAKIYRALGLLKTGQLVETARSDLVVGFVGQTATRTMEKVQEALGGVLFIDEAYMLAPKGDGGQDFGPEAIDTLNKAMEDHRDDLVVIAAGYTEDMKRFIASNEGLRSRFVRTITFEDYSADELVAIFELKAKKENYVPTEGCLAAVRRHFEEILKTPPKGFGNAREVRKLFEAMTQSAADRLYGTENLTREQMRTLTEEDMASAAAAIAESKGAGDSMA